MKDSKEVKDFKDLFAKSFGMVLKAIRDNKRLTQEELALQCCISSREYNDLERGKHLPNAETLTKMVVGVELDFNEVVKGMLEEGYTLCDKEYAYSGYIKKPPKLK